MTARLLTRRGEFDQAIEACARAEALTRDLGDERARVLAVMESADVCLRRGAFDDARRRLETALARAESSADLGAQARALASLATVARELGDFPAALGYLERSGLICRRMGDVRGAARVLANQGNVHLNRGEWAEARRCFEPALRSFRALGAREYEATVLNNMTVALSAGGDYEAASRVAAECLSLRRELGDQWAVAGILDNLGVLQHRRGRSPEARRLLGDSVRLRRELGDQPGLVDSLLSLALVERSLGDRARAADHARAALAASPEGAETIAVARGLLALCGGIEGEAAKREAALGLRAAARLAGDRGDAELEAIRALPAGELLADLADWAALESLGREQVELASAHHMLYEEAWARWCLARAALALGRRDEGLAEARAALALAAESDLRGAHRRISDGLAERCGDQAPRLWCDAVASLERYLEAFAPDERAAYLERGGVGARLAGWLERARAVKDAPAIGALEAALERLR